jgi:hypothetical protein
MAAVWGITTAVFVYTDLEGFPLLLIFILSSGIGAGCMVNFSIWRAPCHTVPAAFFCPGYLQERQTEKLSETDCKLAGIMAKEQQARRDVEKARGKTLELFNLTRDAIVIYTLDGSVWMFTRHS